MAEYRLTNKAVDDLNGIWGYTFDRWSDQNLFFPKGGQNARLADTDPGVILLRTEGREAKWEGAVYFEINTHSRNSEPLEVGEATNRVYSHFFLILDDDLKHSMLILLSDTYAFII